MISQILYALTTWIIPLLLCVIIHEVSHGYVAMRLGDKTAQTAGRLTLNPIPHIDPIGSLLVPGILLLFGSQFLFGWAKPVPIDFRNLRHPKKDMGLVAMAGPLSNFVLAIVFVFIGKLLVAIIPNELHIFQWVMINLRNGTTLSLALCVFNLLPVLPLDGGRILTSLLPYPYDIKYQRSEKYGFLILFGLLFVLPPMGVDIVGIYVNYVYSILSKILYIFV